MTHPMLRRVFSEKFLSQPKYTLERDEPLPHEMHKRKACAECGLTYPNDFNNFPKVPFGDRKLGRHTTAHVCFGCKSRAISEGMKRAGSAGSVAEDEILRDASEGLRPLYGPKR